MNTILKRVISMVLCFVLVVGYLPVGTLAAETVETVAAETTAVTEETIQVLSEDAEEPSESTETTEEQSETTEPSTEATVPENTEETVPETSEETVPETSEETVPETTEETVPETTEETVPEETEVVILEEEVTEEVTSVAMDDEAVEPRAGDPIVVISGSDYQDSGSGTAMKKIIAQIGASSVDGVLMGGDYNGSAYSMTTAQNVETVNNTITDAAISTSAQRIFVQGNHDANLTPGSGNILTTTGAYDTDAYGVYAINYEDFGSASSGLQNYLNNKTGTDPIFVITHQPLHKGRNDNNDAIEIFNVLNEAGERGLNIIFLFGHNHSGTYDDYLGGGAIYLKKGESMPVAGGSGSQTLNFTYMNCGYVGYSRSAACNHLTMTAFEIADTQVTVKRYDESGLHLLKEKGVTVSGYTTNDNEYGYAVLDLSDGTSATYALSGDSTDGGSGDSGDGNTGSGDNSGSTGGSGNVYVLDTDGVSTGEDYLIVSAGADGTAYALRNNNGTVARAEVTISNGQIVTDAEDIVWTYDDSKYLGNDGRYLYLTYNNSISLDANEPRAMAITSNDAGEGAYTVKRDGNYSYYLNYSNSNWTCGSSADDIYFFVRTSETGEGGGSETPDTPDAPTVDTETNGWVTIADGMGKVVYELDTDGTVDEGVEYLIVDDEEALALSKADSSNNTLSVELDGNYAYTDSEDYGWVFTKSGSNYTIRLNDDTYLGRSSSSLTEGSSSNTWTVSDNSDGEYYISVRGSRNTYYVRYTSNGSYFQAGTTQTPVRLYKYVRTEAGGDAEYAKLSDNLTATVAHGADRTAAETAIKEVVDVLVAHTADFSDADAISDTDENITWSLASNYNGTVPGEYAVTISYKGVKLGTAKVVVPDVGVEANDILYYIDESLTAPINATLTGGTPTGGTYTYDVVEGGDAIIESIATADGTITFTGTEGTAQVKITYTYTEGENTATLEKVINVTAKAPYFDVQLCDSVTADGTTTYEPITETIVKKGVKAGDTHPIWAVVKEYNAEHPDGNELDTVEAARLSWSVSDTSIATFNPETGLLTFTGTSFGTFDVTVYYLDEQGEPIAEDTITVSASQSQYVVPGDGTNDFPEYPDQGAIRFDKTAVAQGNFSQSGIAKVELSMTGVPYGSSEPTDVVIMVDMTTSMYHYGYVDDADAAIKSMLEALVYDAENNKYDSNIYVQVWSFKSDDDGEDVAFVNNLTRRNIADAAALTAAKNAIAFDTNGNDGSGTCYDEGTKKMYEIVRSCTTDNVVAVFASDGGPSRYTYLDSNGAASEISGSNASVGQDTWFNNNGTVTEDYLTEYYTYLLKTQQIPVYTVGVGIDANTPEAHVLEHMSSEYDATGKTVSTAPANATTDYFALADINTTPDVLSTVFTGIAASIREAATNVVVEDKIDTHYTVNFSLPSGVTAAEAGMDDFYIKVLGYELDENNDRMADPNVLEIFLFDSEGTITHTVGGNACGETCGHVTKTGTKVTGIDGTYFDYTIDAKGDEFLTWKAEKLDRTELALEYFVYLDNSAGVEDAADQVEAGTYPTNEYATITYKNFNGKECQRYFPVPTMTWMGAKVTYTFYLVNEAGQPVNRAGKIIPFAEAIYVTDPVTKDVHWNELEGAENMLAENLLATAKVPDVYDLYDNAAYYEIRVYQTEDTNKNYFIIEGSNDVSNKETTKVFNTKAGNRYDDYGAYSATAGSYTSHQSNQSYTATVTEGIDYANTTVAFAVVWKPELIPDAVVMDYGLDVVIDVATNDALASGVTGVSNTKPAAEINKGTYNDSVMRTSAEILIDDYVVGTAKVENLTSVRFSLNKANGMQFSDPVEFFYESICNFYTYSNSGERTLNTTHMYSSVTVIPATTIYYEDDFLTLTSFSKENGSWSETADSPTKWTTEGSKVTSTQDQDRPGESQISAALDADNNYGYDSAYESMSTHSLGSSAKITVDANTRGEATFTFYGTGFDIIGLTSNATGTMTVKVYSGTEAAGTALKTTAVDTFYGYEKNAEGNWVVTLNNPNALYQVPVIKITGMDYGQYTVKVTAGYSEYFDHIEGSTSYDLYLDAIRIYDPTGNLNTEANNAYVQDGEGWPQYIELRNNIIEASNVTVTENEDGTINVTVNGSESGALSGAIFIDSNNATTSIADYVSYGPNNELYLAAGQSVAFALDQTNANILADVQIAMKLGNGESVSYEMYNAGANGAKSNIVTGTLKTATDLYYGIKDPDNDPKTNDDLTKGTIVIKNNGGGILSITNIKVTYKQNPYGTSTSDVYDVPMTTSLFVNEEVATAAVMSLRFVAEEPEIPETSEPEETKPVKPTKTDLQDAVAEAKKLKEKDYTKDSFNAVKSAIKAAEKVLKNKKASDAQIEAALEALNSAVEALEAKPDSTALKKAVDAAKKLKERDYTKESFKTFKAALKAAEKILKDRNATQAEIDETLAELSGAMGALVKKSSGVNPGKKR